MGDGKYRIGMAARVDTVLRAASAREGWPLVSISFGTFEDKATWQVQPSDSQSFADPLIADFDLAGDELYQQWHVVRTKRNALLAACDWTHMPDMLLPDDVRTAWTTYRQALRAVPQTQTDPYAIVWPTPPA